MNLFRKLTIGDYPADVKQNIVIMGKNTWLLIPNKYRGLSSRINIIISNTLTIEEIHDQNSTHAQTYLVKSLQDAMRLINSWVNTEKDEKTKIDKSSVGDVFICGGSRLYDECMQFDMIDTIYLTKIQEDYKCDNFIWALWEWPNSSGRTTYRKTILSTLEVTDNIDKKRVVLDIIKYDKL